MGRSLLALLAILAQTGALPPPPVNVTVPCVDDAMDLHGNPDNAGLVIFAAGNQWFVMPALLAAFQRAHPEVRSIFYETLPPGVLAQQMESGAIQVGGLILRVHPDVYLSGKSRMETMQKAGLVGTPVVYASNALAIMVRAGNPKHVASLADLGRPDVRVAMPNPKTEGIARQIELAYRKSGGSALDTAIMRIKLQRGTTLLTAIHHRQTPMWILNGSADAGPVWLSEALYQERVHSGVVMVRIPAAQNVEATYLAAAVTSSAHPRAAQAFVEFSRTAAAQSVYRSYGFTLPTSQEASHP